MARHHSPDAFKVVGTAASLAGATPIAYQFGQYLLADPGPLPFVGAGFVAGSVAVPAVASQIRRGLQKSKFSYTYDYVKIECEFADDRERIPTVWRQTRVLRAQTSGVNRVVVSLAYGEEPSGEGIKTVHSLSSSGDITVLQPVPVPNPDAYEPGRKYEIRFSRDLQKGERVAFSLDIDMEHDPGRDAGPRLMYKVVRPTRRVDVQATFAGSDCPRDSVARAVRSPGEGLVMWSRESELNARNEASWVFRRPIQGRAYGLRWEWTPRPAG